MRQRLFLVGWGSWGIFLRLILVHARRILLEALRPKLESARKIARCVLFMLFYAADKLLGCNQN